MHGQVIGRKATKGFERGQRSLRLIWCEHSAARDVVADHAPQANIL